MNEHHGPLEFRMGYRLLRATIAERIDSRQTVYRLKLEKPSILDFIPILCIRLIFVYLFNLWPKSKILCSEWFLSQTVILKKRKPDWNEEFEVEKLIYRRLQPLQGKFIPYFYGEAIYDESPALVLFEIVGQRLFDLTMKPGEDEEFERKLKDAYKAFTMHRVTHDDPKLDNAIDVGDRVMIIDLEQCIIEDTKWKGSTNKGNAGYLLSELQLKRQYEDEARQREKKTLQENAERMRLRNQQFGGEGKVGGVGMVGGVEKVVGVGNVGGVGVR